MIIQLTEDDYKNCVEAATAVSTINHKKSDTWANGAFNNNRNLSKYKGFLGEAAVGQVFGLTPHYGFGSEKVDFRVELSKFLNKNVEVKMSNGYTQLLVRCMNEYGGLVPLDADVYICVYVPDKITNIGYKPTSIEILGYATRDEILLTEPKPSRMIGTQFWNYEIPKNKLHSIEELMSTQKV